MKKLVFIMVALLGLGFVCGEDLNRQEVRSECFDYLKLEMQKNRLYEGFYNHVEDFTYADLESKFSKYYKNASSFGVDLDEARFEMRLYSFGEPTAYQHPPLTPYPSTQLADKWERPVKNMIIAEEYIRDDKGNRIFISCEAFRIDSNDLMNVTAEKYAYDGVETSILQTDSGNGYKLWFSGNIGFNHQGKMFVYWNRLFVFPQSTENDYFSKYTIIDSYPVHKVTDLAGLFDKPDLPVNDPEKMADLGYSTGINLTIVDSTNGRIISGDVKEEFLPVEPGKKDLEFSLNSFYEAIEIKYPKLAEMLALNGSLHYDTVKILLLSINEESINPVWETLRKNKELTKYYVEKQQGKSIENKEYDELLNQIATNELEYNVLQDLSHNNKYGHLVTPEILKKSREQIIVTAYVEPDYSNMYLIVSVGGILIVVLIGLYVRGRKN